MPLTFNQIKALQPDSKPRRYADGHGLYLKVSPQGGKLWRLKYRLAGKERRLSLGIFPDVSLKEARHAAQAAKLLIKKGVDPSAAKRSPADNQSVPFRLCDATAFAVHVPDARNKGYEVGRSGF